eukprot:5175293-Amphidinium_carterae.1
MSRVRLNLGKSDRLKACCKYMKVSAKTGAGTKLWTGVICLSHLKQYSLLPRSNAGLCSVAGDSGLEMEVTSSGEEQAPVLQFLCPLCSNYIKAIPCGLSIAMSLCESSRSYAKSGAEKD